MLKNVVKNSGEGCVIMVIIILMVIIVLLAAVVRFMSNLKSNIAVPPRQPPVTPHF